MRITRILAPILFATLSWPAWAQVDVHFYGGAGIVPKDGGRGYIGGAGAEAGYFYLGVDGHGLRPTGESRQVLQTIANTVGTSVSLEATGFNFVGGPSIRASDRFSVAPVGIIGYTRGEFCIETICDDSFREANVGGGLMAKIMASDRIGFHVGARYTRHYGTAVTAGIVIRAGQ